ADDVGVLRTGLDPRTPCNGRNAVAALTHGALGAAEWRIASIWVNVLPGAIVARPKDVSVLIETKRANLVHDPADPRIILNDRIRVFALRERFFLEFGGRHVRLMHLHEVDAHEERLCRIRVAVEIVERCLLDILIEERNAHNTLLRRVDVLTV